MFSEQYEASVNDRLNKTKDVESISAHITPGPTKYGQIASFNIFSVAICANLSFVR